ncbi:MAG: multidrug efflux RND transporter permease subunit [Pseudomonadota bacterium]
MFSNFFIQRPIFASVIAIVIVVAGAVSIPLLPTGEFPQIAPPTVQVSSTYTGGSADVVEGSVTTVLEEQINGVEGMVYMSSTSSNDGTSNIIVTFEEGYDLDIAAVDVQNRVSIAQAQLPDEVIRQGISVTKQSNDLTIAINLISPDGRFDDLFISNYASINIIDALKRIPGVGTITVWGERTYAMRIWLNRDKLANLGLTAGDVADAVSEQNQQVAAGSIGQPPAPKGQKFQYTVTTLGRLATVEEFENIIVRTGGDGAVVYLKDVARVELGAQLYTSSSNLNGKPTVGLGVFQLAGANSIDLADGVRAEMAKLGERFPEGLEYRIIYDTTEFVRASIKEVLYTLLEAIGLVFLVIMVFLQSGRATLIPAITIPVCLIGTFALMNVLGFSINTLTLFGLVLAVGLVVDDAIVVVENVSRHLEDGDLTPLEAARNAMGQVTGPIVATSLVLMAVFVPVAFIPGVTGELYKQFALTIACAVGISAINALTLSPALCGVFLRPAGARMKNRFSRAFDRMFEVFTAAYERAVGVMARLWYIVAVAFVALLVGTYFMFQIVPTGFIPDEDQGYLIFSLQAPEGTSIGRMEEISLKVDKILHDTPGVANVITFTGFSFISNTSAPNVASIFPVLAPWDQRTTPETSAAGILEKVQAEVAQIPDAIVIGFNPPSIRGLSATGGFEFELQDYTGGSLLELSAVTQEMVAAGNARPELSHLFSPFAADTPQYYVNLDRTKALSQGVAIGDVFEALEVYLGALYVNDFNIFGRVFQVYLQADAHARAVKEDIGKIYVRNDQGGMVPLSALATVEAQIGARTINHYNLFRSASIDGGQAPGFSSSQAIAAMEELADEILPETMGYEWTGNAYQQLKAGNVAPLVFALALLFVFLFLAAQYESWIMPFMVLLAVPLAMFGALGAQWIRGLENDIYCQIGLVMLIGLASKNAILIIEFARRRRAEGLSIEMAAMEAARVRLRPILMTAFAFIFGVLPLVVASGAGSNARHSLGTAVFGGMIAATFLSLILVPVLYVVIERMREKVQGRDEGRKEETA